MKIVGSGRILNIRGSGGDKVYRWSSHGVCYRNQVGWMVIFTEMGRLGEERYRDGQAIVLLGHVMCEIQ